VRGHLGSGFENGVMRDTENERDLGAHVCSIETCYALASSYDGARPRSLAIIWRREPYPETKAVAFSCRDDVAIGHDRFDLGAGSDRRSVICGLVAAPRYEGGRAGLGRVRLQYGYGVDCVLGKFFLFCSGIRKAGSVAPCRLLFGNRTHKKTDLCSHSTPRQILI
jgi:hypothetical protein